MVLEDKEAKTPVDNEESGSEEINTQQSTSDDMAESNAVEVEAVNGADSEPSDATEKSVEADSPKETVEVSQDDFSFFFSILDEDSDDYAWAKKQLNNTVPVNDIVEEYEAAEKARLEAEAKAKAEAEAQEKARLEAEAKAKAEAEAQEKARLEAEAKAKAEAEAQEKARLEAEAKAKAEAEAQEKARFEAETKAAAETAEKENANTETVDEFQTENTPLFAVPEIHEKSSTDGFVESDKKVIDAKLAKLEATIEKNSDAPDYRSRIHSALSDVLGEKNNDVHAAPVTGNARKIFAVVAVALFALDMFFINIASYKTVYMLMAKLLRSNGVEALRLTEEAFSRIFVGVSYVASFLLGGIAVLITAKLVEYIIKGLEFSNSRVITWAIVSAFALIFIVGTVVTAIVSESILSIYVYRWAGPMLTYLGGMLFLGISKINLSIDY